MDSQSVKNFKSLLLAMALVGLWMTSPSTLAGVDIDVDIAPPAAVMEAPPAAPRPGYVWAPGYYRWEDGRHVWVQGRWMAERPGYRWEPDRWEPRGPRYHYVPGHWVR